ncbi:MAG: CoA transferase [Candidatus Dormibacteraeota bacterium]|uniref:CoA transferase n=1 Tax=Candidatus Dormiibacter inghamiae TaxID=3127013 RepID=A0A934NHQ9_9BACT|nr:CoA transferase [Candidatus Dormibacteraeota bacterium]MBJ7606296.1 CoA transferase [Candidatus Dormibacteraeota bacterium]
MSAQVLDGRRVIDIATLAAGPWIAQRLGDFGADVIKVEQPGIGDHQRRWGSRKNGEPLFWKSIARNKRSVALDLRRAGGVRALKRLLLGADVLVENFRPGTLERWGLGPDVLLALNPGLVIARVTGFGQDGPYSQRPGFGSLAEGMSGFSHMTGAADRPPTLPSMPLADGVAGLTGAFAVMLALYHRDVNRGGGQVIDISLTESLLPLMEPTLLEWDQLGANLRRTGNTLAQVAPRTAYECADGQWVVLSASAQSIYERLARVIGRPELIADPRFVDNQARVVNVAALDQIIGEWMARFPREEVLRRMDEAQVAVGPIYDLPGVYSDPHFQARGSFITVHDPDLGPIRLVAVTPRLSATPGRIRHTGPSLGQHNSEVFAEFGIHAADAAGVATEART